MKNFWLSIFLAICMLPAHLCAKEKIDLLLDSLHRHLLFDSVRVDILNDIGYEYWIVDPRESEVYGEQALNLAKQLSYLPGMAFAHRVIGVAHWARGNYNPALEHLVHSMEIYSSLGDKLGEANCLLNIGLVYGDQSFDKQALEYFNRALDRFKELDEDGRIATTYTKIGTIYANQGNHKAALEYFQKALFIHESNQFKYGIAEAYNRMGIVALEQGKLDEAMRHLLSSLNVGESIDDHHGIASNKYYLGKIYRMKGDIAKARTFFGSALELATELDIKKFIKEVSWELKDIAEIEGDSRQALAYFYTYNEARESLFNEELASSLAELESRMLIREKETELAMQGQQIALLKKQGRLDRAFRLALLVLILTLLLAGFLIVRTQSLKIRNTRLRQEELKKQLAFKNKELASYAINFVQKNELLESVKRDISQLRNGTEKEVDGSLRQLERQIDESFQIDKDWAEFEQRFEDLHSRFFSGLKERYPGLSSNDLRLCALLRLNLNIKEMAAILHISPDSVKTARYRLRKKLDLHHDEKLIDFLLRIDRENMLV